MSDYYTLMTSLPRINRNFKVKELPISPIQLEKRLKLLNETDQTILNDLNHLIWNSWFSPELPFAQTLKDTKKLLALNNSFMNKIIYWYFDLRSILTALGLRKNLGAAPENPNNFWFTHWNTKLINHWNEPDFGLKGVYPFFAEMVQKISNNEIAASEDIFLSQLWKHLEIIETNHYFDFEAVIIYLLRWNIVNYWAQFDETVAMERINELATEITCRL